LSKDIKNRFPKGWSEKRVATVAAYYENQSDEEAAAEDEAGFHKRGETMMSVPTSLVPKVQRLIGSTKAKQALKAGPARKA